MTTTKVHRLSAWEELRLWWVASGELYVLCCLWGFMSGYQIGQLLGAR